MLKVFCSSIFLASAQDVGNTHRAFWFHSFPDSVDISQNNGWFPIVVVLPRSRFIRADHSLCPIIEKNYWNHPKKSNTAEFTFDRRKSVPEMKHIFHGQFTLELNKMYWCTPCPHQPLQTASTGPPHSQCPSELWSSVKFFHLHPHPQAIRKSFNFKV